ncbi:MAG: Fumarate hydratase class II [Chlamydiales bacterium]|nr:Fumarate hydratase class II [Chlamydiales bacterium]MCH9620378.1 Fumarate hydratase class II [Chlamydiales bacterium]MCH9622976.1 Fumarate hydratase class II [Chlamydiales bacterium]
MKKRVERDTLGEIEVPADRYYGAQTERSLLHFEIGEHRIPSGVICALGLIKKIAAEVNCDLGLLSSDKRDLIVAAAKRVVSGELEAHFPLKVWQTGSGTQTNMNVNEVISNVAIEAVGGKMGTKDPIHPVDDVNKSQSSNDVFPTAMSIAAVSEVTTHLLPQVHHLHKRLVAKQKEFEGVIKTGRTHLMDATPVTLGQEFSGYAAQVEQGIERIEKSLSSLCELAIGGTAVGTGLNAPKGFAEAMAKGIAKETGLPFVTAPNKFAVMAAHDALVAAHGALKTLAVSLFKIATDLAWMVSGPKCGFGELFFPANEPGSSIMAGKVNPTQCEALIMVCTQVMGHDTTLSFAGALGNFELNVLKPVMIYNFLDSCTLLGKGCQSFADHFVMGLKPNQKQIEATLERSLMLVTALVPKIGYDKAAKVAGKALEEGVTLKCAAESLGLLTADEYDQVVDPKKMI